MPEPVDQSSSNSLLHLSKKRVRGYFRLLGEDLRIVLGIEEEPPTTSPKHGSLQRPSLDDRWRNDPAGAQARLERITSAPAGQSVPPANAIGDWTDDDALTPGERPDEIALREQTRQAEEALLDSWKRALDKLEAERAAKRETYLQKLDEARESLQGLALSAREKVSTDTPGADGDAPQHGQQSELFNTDEPPYSPPAATPAAAIEHAGEDSAADGDDLPPEPYRFPDLELLELVEPDKTVRFVDPDELELRQNQLQRVLDSFTVDAQVCDAIVGPRVTQFRVRPGVGVRVEAITALDRNIALGMEAESVRLQAPIPGEAFVGVEIPNRHAVPICLRKIFASRTWHEDNGVLPLALGIDITGRIVLTDLTKTPHLLIAGATGSGKSVCMNNIILSLLYRFSPEQLELALVDPKKVEFSLYRDVPHLIHPVVTESKMVVGLLHWMVIEMERRYTLLADHQVRNITAFNEKALRDGFQPLPYTVLIIDELADLMMTHGHEVETHLARLAQLSRAAGIHTILATQRPSVNVITGVIKANFPTRIAFRVSSQIDSRTILDGKGAESLLGRGDMLFNPPGASRLMRIQGPMVEDHEIERVVEHIAANRSPRYRIEIPDETTSGPAVPGIENKEGGDPMLKQALEVIFTHERATTSFLQRRLKIGYNRAASIIDELEAQGFIGPQIGNLPREILRRRESL